MLKHLLTIVLMVFSVQYTNAQKIIVIDAHDSKPVKDVAVYNDSKTKFGYTDLAGEFSIDAFNENDHLNFQHPTYEPLRLTRKQVENHV